MGFLAILPGNLGYMPVSFSAWVSCSKGFADNSVGNESICNAGDLGSIPGFDPWVGEIPGRRKRLPTPVFWCGESEFMDSQSMGSQRVRHD